MNQKSESLPDQSTTITLYVCPDHGSLSERELENASETVYEDMPISGDGMGEPFLCPIWVRDNTPTPPTRQGFPLDHVVSLSGNSQQHLWLGRQSNPSHPGASSLLSLPCLIVVRQPPMAWQLRYKHGYKNMDMALRWFW